MEKVDVLVKKIWGYMVMNQDLKNSDAILGLGSHDTRVAHHCVDLYKEGFSKKIIFSGGLGTQTSSLFSKPEAEIFADIAIESGIPENSLILEKNSTNTGENIIFTRDLLAQLNLSISNMIVVTKPYMERRAYATFKKQWPEMDIIMSSPRLSFEDYINSDTNPEKTINIMVGDLVRIKEYPKIGFQIEQEIPDDVWQAAQELIEMGYDKHLPKI